ncbi:Choline kinase [Actinidia chinensis var. chinensis]|uniref:Choline kinase n=1 Tax=Actinidia chinensis var. chinensis TaxID=1590841 RepID=A0A2R6P4B7_ACTCC|nr:Choline kinase [Actinidia chinensis var. chinensis]
MAVKANGFIIPEELMKILLSLASNWGDLMDPNTLKVVHLSGAMTNEIYRISWPIKTGNDSRSVLVRIYGKGVEIFFNKDEEIRTFECISGHGQGPQLLGQFPDGRIEEFIHARTLSACDLRDPVISPLIAAKLREFHNLEMPGSKTVALWDRLRNWLSVAKNLCTPEHGKEFCLDALEEEICVLEKEVWEEHQELGFCHNDLQYGNIMINEETKSITIIDYEYATYNPVAYDIANHFCEMVANYHTDTPHVLTYTSYPGLEERRRFVHLYLSSGGNEPGHAEVEQLVEDAEKYTLANHLFWGLWGIISAYVNNIDFDYMEYARQRFQQYWLRRPEFLGTSRGFTEDDVNDSA